MKSNVVHPPTFSASRQVWGLVGWIVLCMSASVTAVFVSTGDWYAALHKPAWNPPSWVFGPVWTFLYLTMALAAWLVWREGGWRDRRSPLGLFLLQWFLNVLWTPIFFAMHRPGASLVEIIALWVALAATIASFWRVRALAGAVLLPYLAWVTFAAILNFEIWSLNR